MSAHGLRCNDLTFRRSGGHTVLEDVAAHFAAGEAALITGPTGAGKSTLLHLLGCILRPTSGEVWAAGRPVSRWTVTNRDAWRQQVGIVFQHLHLMVDLPVQDNVLLPCIPRSNNLEDVMPRLESMLSQLDLTPLKSTRVQQLSGGQRQRVALARALVDTPRYILLDEPTAFQDDGSTERIIDLCAASVDAGACLVVCSHDTRLLAAKRLFSKVYTLDRSRLRERQ